MDRKMGRRKEESELKRKAIKELQGKPNGKMCEYVEEFMKVEKEIQEETEEGQTETLSLAEVFEDVN